MRRKVIEAEKAAPEIAREAIDLVRSLYAVERQAKDLSSMARLELRQEESAPVLTQLRNKLLEWKEQLLPKHPMAEAINYALGQWAELNVFCADGAVSIDNNASEREMKLVVLNRKNSLFVVCRQSAWRRNGGDPEKPDQHMPPARCAPPTVSHAVADQPIASSPKRTAQLAARSVETTSGGTLAFVAYVPYITLTIQLAEISGGRSDTYGPIPHKTPSLAIVQTARKQRLLLTPEC